LYLFKTPNIIKWVYPELVWNGSREKPIVYLTFDDGPVPGITDRILDILNGYKIRATFFCVGENIEKHPDLFRRIHEEGHMIGNHTYHHLNGWRHSVSDYLSDIQQCAAAIEENGFLHGIKLFRPPYGKIRKKGIGNIKNQYHIIMWDVLSYDFSKKVNQDRILRKSLQYSEGGSIVIFHDSEKTKNRTNFLISQYIDRLLSKNYEFSTVDQLILLN